MGKRAAESRGGGGGGNLGGEAAEGRFLLLVGRRRHLTACGGEGAERRAEAAGLLPGRDPPARPGAALRPEPARCSPASVATTKLRGANGAQPHGG